MERLGLKLDKLAGVSTEGSLNLMKNVGLLKWIQDKVSEMNPELRFLLALYHMVSGLVLM